MDAATKQYLEAMEGRLNTKIEGLDKWPSRKDA